MTIKIIYTKEEKEILHTLNQQIKSEWVSIIDCVKKYKETSDLDECKKIGDRKWTHYTKINALLDFMRRAFKIDTSYMSSAVLNYVLYGVCKR